MIVDKSLANLEVLWILRSGDTGRGRAEHRNILQFRFTHHNVRFRLSQRKPNKRIKRATVRLQSQVMFRV